MYYSGLWFHQWPLLYIFKVLAMDILGFFLCTSWKRKFCLFYGWRSGLSHAVVALLRSWLWVMYAYPSILFVWIWSWWFDFWKILKLIRHMITEIYFMMAPIVWPFWGLMSRCVYLLYTMAYKLRAQLPQCKKIAGNW